MLLQQLINGITLGATYALATVGFSLVYGVLELANFANGAFYILGAYFAMVLYASMGMNFAVSLALALAGTGILGAAMDAGLLRPIRSKGGTRTSMMISTLGVGTAITNLIIVLFGSETKRFPDAFGGKRLEFASAVVTYKQLFTILLCIVVMVVLSILVYRTKLGRAMRAISQNPVAARLMGIDTNTVILLTFFIGTMCAALSGTVVSMYLGSLDTTMYSSVNIKMFASAILGGVGSLPGAVLGGMILGMLETFVSGYISTAYKDVFSFAILILVLLFRPAGLLGQRTIKKV
ncbi:MAG: branched-chain amino acid ABC transporter permease [Lachnospiraceae bacterium]|nr:branched-chain amino acid ABC transporter permease [Lachnospiraceae bacterium]